MLQEPDNKKDCLEFFQHFYPSKSAGRPKKKLHNIKFLLINSISEKKTIVERAIC